jgi:hypothetical protein
LIALFSPRPLAKVSDAAFSKWSWPRIEWERYAGGYRKLHDCVFQNNGLVQLTGKKRPHGCVATLAEVAGNLKSP